MLKFLVSKVLIRRPKTKYNFSNEIEAISFQMEPKIEKKLPFICY